MSLQKKLMKVFDVTKPNDKKWIVELNIDPKSECVKSGPITKSKILKSNVKALI